MIEVRRNEVTIYALILRNYFKKNIPNSEFVSKNTTITMLQTQKLQIRTDTMPFKSAG